MRSQIEKVFKSNVPLAEHTTLRIGGPARFFCRARYAWEVEHAVDTALSHGIPWILIGEGSNILVPDEGIDAAVIAFHSDTPPSIDKQERVIVSGGTSLNELVYFCASQGYSGFETLAGIPGTVGGAIAGNAGAYGSTISDYLQSVRLLTPDGSSKNVSADQLAFEYRTSRLRSSSEIVLQATFQPKRGQCTSLISVIEETLIDRHGKHPNYRHYPTVGSFFKNLPPLPGTSRRRAAGKLLEEVGAKNLRKGDAGLWHAHANIVINYGRASAGDVKSLTDEMSRLVHERFGIALEPEITIFD